MPPVSVIVFDLDDTLYPERAYAFSGFGAVAAAFADLLGDPDDAAARMRLLFDTEHRPRVFNTLLAEKGLEQGEPLIARMIDTYRTHQPRIALHQDGESALSRLRGPYKLGLITDGPAVMQRAKIEALALLPRFGAIILTDELGEGFGKPDPRAFALMSARLGADARRCVYVADNLAKDFVAPNALGWMAVRIDRADGVYANARPPEGGQPDHVIATLDHLDELLQRVP